MRYRVMIETDSGTIGRAPHLYEVADRWKAVSLAYLLPQNSNARRVWVEENREGEELPIINIHA